ncbi:MAG: MarR family transcriptional regulator [Helicobacter sp.]|uniref:MarR family winged helix-turn-helix transcriptional regulator n=1 Tax=Helicobacter sp. TaxID=218 RepID=UPI0025C738D5|nr:MarR family transcriptional regulator [Helicobacter sp.]MCH5313183.1 MarR family transcriptional regulator [Helicobacter sp.]
MEMQHFIGHHIGKTTRYLQSFFINDLKTYDLSFEQGIILFIVSEYPHTCISDIAKRLDKNKTTISREVNSLVKKGFCLKDSLHNQRTLSLSLTTNGKKAVSYIKERIKQTQKLILTQCTQQEIDICIDVLTRIQLILESNLKNIDLNIYQ